MGIKSDAAKSMLAHIKSDIKIVIKRQNSMDHCKHKVDEDRN
jgi:hypothetical protein